ncbi:hypothetical protein [Streptomyces sp. NPDC007856]|uniref:hypothetical protein n=1 Tax=Streptomyces sp. NPDC007856 TaxID=3364781 RepID=UPI00369ED7B5
MEERARQHENGTEVGLSQAVVGCCHPENDYFYRQKMQDWEPAGIAQVHTAFSAVTGHPARFVQNAIANAADTVWQAIEDGAYIYVCGDGRRMAPAVREALAEIDPCGGRPPRPLLHHRSRPCRRSSALCHRTGSP